MLSEIHNCYDRLTDVEKKVAASVLTAPQDAVKMTAKELAQHSGTVPSAVVRFCKSMAQKVSPISKSVFLLSWAARHLLPVCYR